MFTWLADLGVTRIERKDHFQIHLDDYEITGDDPWANLSATHEQLSIDFVHTYLDHARVKELAEKRDDGKKAFISRV